jgi:arylformamidase
MLVELSYPIGFESTVLPMNLEAPIVYPRSRVANGDAHNTSYFKLFAHTGTHIDSPWHFNDMGATINDLPISFYCFENVEVISIPKEPWQPVKRNEVEKFDSEIERADALLILTGFGEKRADDPEEYLRAFPGLSMEAAEYLRSFKNLRCIGVDWMSIENLEKNKPLGYPVHHILLEREPPMILLEDVKLQALDPHSRVRRLYLFPLRIEGLEASPVTAVAEIE